jgi:hypothetical protein
LNIWNITWLRQCCDLKYKLSVCPDREVHTCCPDRAVHTCYADRAVHTCCPDRAVHTCYVDRAVHTCCPDRAVHTCCPDRAVHTCCPDRAVNTCCPDRAVHTCCNSSIWGAEAEKESLLITQDQPGSHSNLQILVIARPPWLRRTKKEREKESKKMVLLSGNIAFRKQPELKW